MSLAVSMTVINACGFMSSFPQSYSSDEQQDSANSTEQSCHILIVDDDPAMRSLLVDELREPGCRIVEASDGKEASARLQGFTPDLIITDLKMPDGGFDYLHKLRQALPHCPIVLITAFGDSQTKSKAKECGVTTYIDKPVRISDLKASLTQICRMRPCNNSSTLSID